jgi:hypothetical protein
MQICCLNRRQWKARCHASHRQDWRPLQFLYALLSCQSRLYRKSNHRDKLGRKLSSRSCWRRDSFVIAQVTPTIHSLLCLFLGSWCKFDVLTCLKRSIIQLSKISNRMAGTWKKLNITY